MLSTLVSPTLDYKSNPLVAAGQAEPPTFGPVFSGSCCPGRGTYCKVKVVAGRKALSQDLSSRPEEAYSLTLCSPVWKFGAYAQCPSLRALRGLSTWKLQLSKVRHCVPCWGSHLVGFALLLCEWDGWSPPV